MRRPAGLSVAIGFALIVTASALVSSCATTRARASTFEAEGIYGRHLRLRVTPAQTRNFEAIMKRCVAVASAADLGEEYAWLCYREPPGRYWVLMFSATPDGFATPGALLGFVKHIDEIGDEADRGELVAMLDELEYEIEWEVVFQRKASWSSTRELNESSNPKARIIDRSIRPGMEDAFDDALARRTTFFVEHGYPLPVEGFVVRSGAPGRAFQVVFPVDWPSFHRTDSFFAFSKGLDQTRRDLYAAHKAALMPTMSSAEYHDGDFVSELSYGAE